MGVARRGIREAQWPAEVLRARTRHAARTSRLQAITAALSRAVTPEEVARTLVERSLAAIRAARGGVWLLGEPGGEARLVFGAGLEPPGGAPEQGALGEGPRAALAAAMRRNEPAFADGRTGRWSAPAGRRAEGTAAGDAFACLPLEAEGRCTGGVAFVFDGPHPFDYDEQVFLLVLARQAAQALLRAAAYRAEQAARAEAEARFDEARRAIRARDDVLAIVSHDLKTPLEAVLLSAALLLRDPESPRVRRYAESLQRSAARMDRLIRELLDLSRMDAGQFRVERRPARLETLVGEALEVLGPLADEKQISLGVEGAPLQDAVGCDPERMLQVVSNLVGNALAFAPRGGHVTVRLALGPCEAAIAVEDDGPGIAAEDLPRVFDRFWKSGSPQGTGLGLAIARGIVEAHGGRIGVESRPGAGTTFRVTLPRG